MFSWTIDYRQPVHHFSQELNRLSPFNPLDCLAIKFETILIRFAHVLGFRSISGLLFILHWWGFFIGRQPGWNIWMRQWYILNDIELLALPHVALITSIRRLSEYLLCYVHEIIWWLCGKMICHSQKYTRDHWVMRREALWLYAIILYSPTDC